MWSRYRRLKSCSLGLSQASISLPIISLSIPVARLGSSRVPRFKRPWIAAKSGGIHNNDGTTFGQIVLEIIERVIFRPLYKAGFRHLSGDSEYGGRLCSSSTAYTRSPAFGWKRAAHAPLCGRSPVSLMDGTFRRRCRDKESGSDHSLFAPYPTSIVQRLSYLRFSRRAEPGCSATAVHHSESQTALYCPDSTISTRRSRVPELRQHP
jgi:hypothetical protein